MAGIDIKLKGAKLTLQEIPLKRVLMRKVQKNNSTSGKITVPKDFIGKEIYIVVPK